jgi:hypothetical protein
VAEEILNMVNALGITNISERSRKRLEEFLSLEKIRVGKFALRVALEPIFLPPRTLFSGRTYFNIYLVNGHERVSEKPVIDKALYSVGGKGVLAWIEIGYYRPEVTFKKEKGNLPEATNIAFTDAEWKLFKLLGDLIPAGGHMMMPYDLDDNILSRMTFAALQKNIPMVATPIGSLLFRIGFTIPFRDWYIPEGGHEGPRKLQFEKPLTAEREKLAREKIINELTVFIEKFPDAKDVELVGRCKDNAREIRDRILKSPLKTRQDR